MTKADLIDEVSKLSNLTKKETETIVNTVFDNITDALAKGDKVVISKMEHHSGIVPWQLRCARDGAVLPRHRPVDAGALMRAAAEGHASIDERTMVEAVLDDGQRVLALNEVFLGHRSHQSARYLIRCAVGESAGGRNPS